MLKRVVARFVLLVVAVLANSSVIFFNDNVNGSVAAKFNISHIKYLGKLAQSGRFTTGFKQLQVLMKSHKTL